MQETEVLFPSTGNSARSQVAVASLRRYAGDRLEAYSTGLERKGINPCTVRVMEEIGPSLDGHHSKPLTESLDKVHFGYLITVFGAADDKCHNVLRGLGQQLHWELEDPAAFVDPDEETLVEFREVRDQIVERVKGWAG